MFMLLVMLSGALAAANARQSFSDRSPKRHQHRSYNIFDRYAAFFEVPLAVACLWGWSDA